MKLCKFIIALICTLSIVWTSCQKTQTEKNRELSKEANLLEIQINTDQKHSEVLSSEEEFIVKVSPTENNIKIQLLPSADLSKISLKFKVSEGATIKTTDGTKENFSQKTPISYTVYSESKDVMKEYTILLTNESSKKDENTDSEKKAKEDEAAKTLNSIVFSFDDVRVNSSSEQHYDIWTSELGGDWASANSALILTSEREKFNAYSITDGAHSGKAVKLVTLDAGFGRFLGMPIATGTLFLGTFDGSEATTDPLATTKFGVTFDKKPLSLSVYYKYKAGESYTDERSQVISDKKDEASIYAIFYKANDSRNYLVSIDGSNVQSSKEIVARASTEHIAEASEWTKLTLDFKYTEDIDPALLASGAYKLSIIFSSSKDGAKFHGAIGSSLLIDDLELTSEVLSK